MPLPLVTAFEARLHKADGSLSIIMKVNAFGPHDAKIQAERMLRGDIAYAVIRQGMAEVATVHRDRPH